MRIAMQWLLTVKLHLAIKHASKADGEQCAYAVVYALATGVTCHGLCIVVAVRSIMGVITD